jgi:hypothetical protein
MLRNVRRVPGPFQGKKVSKFGDRSPTFRLSVGFFGVVVLAIGCVVAVGLVSADVVAVVLATGCVVVQLTPTILIKNTSSRINTKSFDRSIIHPPFLFVIIPLSNLNLITIFLYADIFLSDLEGV